MEDIKSSARSQIGERVGTSDTNTSRIKKSNIKLKMLESFRSNEEQSSFTKTPKASNFV